MRARPEDILATYEAVAGEWATTGGARTMCERPALAALVAGVDAPRVLDLGCGTGLPLGRALLDIGAVLTGVDGAGAMIAAFRANLPQARAVQADMRGLDMGQIYDAVLAWDSVFHLSPEAQRAMVPVFARHVRTGGRVMFTSGPEAGERIGAVGGRAVYHASLSPAEYRALLAAHGLRVELFLPEAPQFNGRTLWLAQRVAG